MNALSPIPATSSVSLYLDKNLFAQAWEASKLIACAPHCPDFYRDKPEACFLALDIADKLNLPLFTVLQNTYQVGGRPGFYTQFLIGLANHRKAFASPIKLRMSGSVEGGDLTATAFTTLHDGTEVEESVDWAMAVADKWVERNTKYKTIPGRMLKYRAASALIGFYAPEIKLGFPTVEELEDGAFVEAVRLPDGSYGVPPVERPVRPEPEAPAAAKPDPAPKAAPKPAAAPKADPAPAAKPTPASDLIGDLIRAINGFKTPAELDAFMNANAEGIAVLNPHGKQSVRDAEKAARERFAGHDAPAPKPEPKPAAPKANTLAALIAGVQGCATLNDLKALIDSHADAMNAASPGDLQAAGAAIEARRQELAATEQPPADPPPAATAEPQTSGAAPVPDQGDGKPTFVVRDKEGGRVNAYTQAKRAADAVIAQINEAATADDVAAISDHNADMVEALPADHAERVRAAMEARIDALAPPVSDQPGGVLTDAATAPADQPADDPAAKPAPAPEPTPPAASGPVVNDHTIQVPTAGGQPDVPKLFVALKTGMQKIGDRATLEAWRDGNLTSLELVKTHAPAWAKALSDMLNDKRATLP